LQHFPTIFRTQINQDGQTGVEACPSLSGQSCQQMPMRMSSDMIYGIIACRPIFSESSKRVVLAPMRAISELTVPDVFKRGVRRTADRTRCLQKRSETNEVVAKLH
jgi:hypothetical protein